MRTSAKLYLSQVNKQNAVYQKFRKTWCVLSVLVVMLVSWQLKLTGITMAGEAFCGMDEHIHDDTCRTRILACGQEEAAAHTHTEECGSRQLICTLPEGEGHSHTETCIAKTLICTAEESEGHLHGEDCFARELVCEAPEEPEHLHGDACYRTEQSCSLEESEGHIHGDECYRTESGYLCGKEAFDGHSHSAGCYLVEEGTEFCSLPEGSGHTHTDDCYTVTNPCPLTEHIHTAACYSDLSADLEDSEIWEESMADLIKTPSTAENIINVARSQLAVAESTLNFQVDEFNVIHGISRYGQWYGNPYGDWSGMFAGFCLHYAGVEEVPVSAGPETMRLEWETAEMYAPAGEYIPEPGQLLFLDKQEEDGKADAVAIITRVEENVIFVIEGDIHDQVTQIGEIMLYPEETDEVLAETAEETGSTGETMPTEVTPEEVTPEAVTPEAAAPDASDAVMETLYAMEDPAVMGYGIVPFAPGLMMMQSSARAVGDTRTIWLDGTDGGLGHLTGSPNTSYSAKEGDTFTLPAEWTSPSKYHYKLRGWYDVTNRKYYAAGSDMTVTGNAVLYADWVAGTYDIGDFNAQVADTVSTNAFITTHMFDYNYLFNIQSSNAQVTVNNSSHKETWTMVSSGTVQYDGENTLDLIFGEADDAGMLSNPNNRSNRNKYHNADTISANICSDTIREVLYGLDNSFDPTDGSGIVGKTYLGTADHLFQIMDDPSNPRHGYYYFDSLRNALSYNQTDERFYVYEYLSATSDALGSSYADFLPLNSPYANNNGKTPGTYTYKGVDGEYQGKTHYRYDTDYSGGNYNTANGVSTEFAYGMRSDINFYLPNDPGSGQNKDLYGNDIEFEFSGDDDLWVLIDGKVVLDIGGIHQRIGGEINFSTGVVTVKGASTTSLMDLGVTAGDHTLTVLYLERGASMSNCSIYFNLVPRFGLEIQKEDVLTQELLNGAQFTVYEDLACTDTADLWESESAYNQDLQDGELDEFQHTFTVADGKAKLWGLGSGNTYYIKETSAPSTAGYVPAQGVIRLTVEKSGMATYEVDVVADSNGNEPSKGYTVHGVSIDETTKMVHIVVTNAPESVKDTTTVQVVKKWEDKVDHSGDYIKAYLTVTDSDGTVRRIREVILSDENAWRHTWTNIPKYDYDNLTEVRYGVEESYESGYYSTVRQITQIEISETEWAEATTFVDGESYILGNSGKYLSTVSASDAKLTWVDEATAKESAVATWTATLSGKQVKFTNGAGQILSFMYNNSSSRRYFYATTRTSATNMVQLLTPVDAGSGFRFYATRNNSSSGTKYYMASATINNNGQITTNTSNSSSLILTPMKKITQTDVEEVEDWAYQITNTPLEKETSLTVQKYWDYGDLEPGNLHEQFQVTVKLLADGKDTGRTMTLSLKNGWENTFRGLPYEDRAGNVISYTVEEVWSSDQWTPAYAEVKASGGSVPTYRTSINNQYIPGLGGPILPSTGSAVRMMYVFIGGGMMLLSVIWGIALRCKRERRRG